MQMLWHALMIIACLVHINRIQLEVPRLLKQNAKQVPLAANTTVAMVLAPHIKLIRIPVSLHLHQMQKEEEDVPTASSTATLHNAMPLPGGCLHHKLPAHTTGKSDGDCIEDFENAPPIREAGIFKNTWIKRDQLVVGNGWSLMHEISYCSCVGHYTATGQGTSPQNEQRGKTTQILWCGRNIKSESYPIQVGFCLHSSNKYTSKECSILTWWLSMYMLLIADNFEQAQRQVRRSENTSHIETEEDGENVCKRQFQKIVEWQWWRQ